MSGPDAQCCCIACRPGRSQRGCEHAVVMGSSTAWWPAPVTCVYTAGVEGVRRGEQAIGMP
jgi:hypothetical protein